MWKDAEHQNTSKTDVFVCLGVGNVTGYPGVFQGNPHPYPSKPVPAVTGAGFDGYG